jgi:hypothetical protein
MKKWRIGHWVALGTALCWLGINIPLVGRFPTVFADEAENGNQAYNLALTQQLRFSLYDSLFPRLFYPLRETWPALIRPFYIYPLAWSIRAVGFSLEKMRFFSLLAACLALLGVYWAGRILKSPPVGWLAMVILGTRFAFLYTAHNVRPEMLLCLWELTAFLCALYALQSGRVWWALAAGVLAGSAAGVHTNGIVVALPLVVLLGLERRWSLLVIFLAGWISGLTAFVAAADWERFIPGYLVLLPSMTTPPLLANHGNLFRVLADECGLLFGSWIFGDWRGGHLFRILMGWQGLLYIAALFWGFTQKDRACRRPAIFGAFLFLGYALVVARPTYNYTVVLEPYMALTLAAWLMKEGSAARPSLVAVGLSLLCYPLGGFPLMFALIFLQLPKKYLNISLLLFLLFVFFEMSFVRGWISQTAVDVIAFWPFCLVGAVILLVAIFSRRESLKFPAPASLASSLLILITTGTLAMTASIACSQPTFHDINHQLSQMMEPGARVTGPLPFWLDLHEFDYRDSGGLMWFNMLKGQKDLLTPLKDLHPRYVIVDEALGRHLARYNYESKIQGLQGPTRLFPWPHRVLTVMNVGQAYGNVLALIEILWPDRQTVAHPTK